MRNSLLQLVFIAAAVPVALSAQTVTPITLTLTPIAPQVDYVDTGAKVTTDAGSVTVTIPNLARTGTLQAGISLQAPSAFPALDHEGYYTMSPPANFTLGYSPSADFTVLNASILVGHYYEDIDYSHFNQMPLCELGLPQTNCPISTLFTEIGAPNLVTLVAIIKLSAVPNGPEYEVDVNFHWTVAASPTGPGPGCAAPTGSVRVTAPSARHAAGIRTSTSPAATLIPSVVFPQEIGAGPLTIELDGLCSSSVTAVQFGNLSTAAITSTANGKVMVQQLIPADTPLGRYEAVVADSSGTTHTGAYLYVSGIEIIDPNPALLQGSDASSAVVVTDPSLIAQKVATLPRRLAISADGVTKVLIRIPSDVSIQADLISSGAGDLGTLITLSGTSGQQQVLATPVPDPQVGSAVFFIYVAPREVFNKSTFKPFDRNAQDDLTNPDPDDPGTQSVNLKLTPGFGFASNNTGAVRKHRALTLVRPPLVLIHGVWSSSRVWIQGKFLDAVQPMTGTREIGLADYEPYNARSFDPRRPVIEGVEALKAAIFNVLGYYRDNHEIATTQVDVVAHSMGGLMTRVYSQKSQQYLRQENYFAGDVHKMITLDTPHTGTIFAIWGWNHRNDLLVGYPSQESQDVDGLVVTQMGRGTFTIADVLGWAGMYLDQGAVASFLPCSQTNKLIEASPIPTHTLAGARPKDANTNYPARIILKYVTQANPPPTLDNVFGDSDHDTIVDGQSEHGGFTDYDVTGMDALNHSSNVQLNVVHAFLGHERVFPLSTTVVANAATQNVVGQLLKIAPTADSPTWAKLQPPRDVRFDDGATPLSGTCVADPAEIAGPNVRKELASPSVRKERPRDSGSGPYLELTSPAMGAVFAPGDQFNVTAIPQNGLAPTNISFEGDVPVTPAGPGLLQATATVPADFAGYAIIEVFANDSDGVVYRGFTQILVQPNRPFSALTAYPDKLTLSYQSQNSTLTVIPTYDDGTTVTVSGFPGIQFSTSDPTVVTVDAHGQVTAVNNGSATITISANGASVQVPIKVAISNAPPQITAPAPFTVPAGTTRSVMLQATSAFNNQVALSAQSLPAFAQFMPGPGGTATLTLSPQASDTGDYSVQIVADDNGRPPLTSSIAVSFSVTPAGTATGPIIDVKPRSLDLGMVTVSQASQPQTITITNTGDTSGTVTLSTASPFFVSPTSLTLAANGDMKSASVTFMPTGAGASNGTLNVTLSGQSTPAVTAMLTGTGVAPTATSPTISAQPPTLDFGTVNLSSSNDISFSVQNTGGAILHVSANFDTAAPFTVASPGSTFDVNPNSSRTVTVRFTPTAAGLQKATLTLASIDLVTPSLTFVFSGAGAGSIVNGCAATPPNAVSWWTGDGNAIDSLGGNNGTLQGAVTFGAGEVAQAFQFDGQTPPQSADVLIGNPANLSFTSAITIEAWVNPRTVQPQVAGHPMGAILTKWSQDFSDTPSSDSYGLWLIQSADGNSVNLFGALHQPGGVEPNIQGGVIPLNTWTHVATTFDSSSGLYVLYVNGQPVATETSPGPIFSTNHNVLIGREDSYIGRAFDGLIDEVSVYGRALTAAEIYAIFSAGAAGKCESVQPPKPPAISAPVTIDFGSVTLGQTVPPKSFTLSNQGGGTLSVLSLGAPAAPFSLISPAAASTPFNVPAAGTAFTIGLSPTAVGAVSGVLTIATNDPVNKTWNVNLKANVAAPVLIIGISATSLSFGSVNIGQTPGTQTLSITNTGDAAVTVMAKATPPFSVSPASLPLLVGQVGKLTVTFTPTAAGAATGSLTLSIGSPNDPAPIPLSGVGVTPSSPESVLRTLVYHEVSRFTKTVRFGNGGSPVLSGSGNRIVYANAPGDETDARYNDIFVMNPDGSGQRMVDSYKQNCDCGAVVDISADGNTIVSTDSDELRIASATGSAGKRLITNRIIPYIRVSPKGDKVFFVNSRGDASASDPTTERGVYVINADGTGLKEIAGPKAVAALTGNTLDQIFPFATDGWSLDVSADGSRIVFGVGSPAGDRIFQVSADGSGLKQLMGPFTAVNHAAISGDGTKVGYDVIPPPCCSTPSETGTINYDGSGRKALGTNLSGLNTVLRMQLSNDGSKLLYGSSGRLYSTDGSGFLTLSAAGGGFSTDPAVLINGSFNIPTMNSTADRFVYTIADDAGIQQLATLDINPAAAGEAPSVTSPALTQTSIALNAANQSTVMTAVKTADKVTRVSAAVLNAEVSDPDVNAPVMFDDGTNGDMTAGDGIYTSNRLTADCCAALGPRTVRVKAEVRDSGNRRHATAIEFGGLTLVSKAP